MNDGVELVPLLHAGKIVDGQIFNFPVSGSQGDPIIGTHPDIVSVVPEDTPYYIIGEIIGFSRTVHKMPCLPFVVYIYTVVGGQNQVAISIQLNVFNDR